MPTPFPGMDPYLERPGIWQQVHADLIVDIRRFLTPQVRPRYYVAIEQRTYLRILPPPEEVHHRYLEIRDTETHAVITAIEILSPANKISRDGRRQYEEKRLNMLGSMTNLVEIDLLRAGEPLPMYVSQHNDYRMIVSRHQRRPCADVYFFSVRQPIPDIPIPLQPGEEEPVLLLNRLLHDLYDQGSYDLMIDYSQPPVPRLSDQDAEWAEGLLSAR